MKKFLLILLILVLSLDIFAFSAIDNIKKNLVNSKYNIVLPGFDVSLNYVSTVMKDPVGAEALSRLFKGNATPGSLVDIMVVLAKSIPEGSGSLVNFDAGFGFSIDNIGFAFDAEASVNETLENSAELGCIELKPFAKASVSIAYAQKLFTLPVVEIDGTLISHFNFVVVNNAISPDLVYYSSDKMIQGVAGIAFPVDFRTDLKFSNCINGYVEFDNIFANYGVYHYENADEIALSNGSDSYKEPFKFVFGADYHIPQKWGDIGFYADVDTSKGLKQCFSVSADVNLYDYLNCTLGLYGGYLGSSLSVGYKNNRIKLSYGWCEQGSVYGQSAVDKFTIGLTTGFKR